MKKLKIILVIILVLVLIPLGINFYVIYSTKDKIFNINEIDKKYDYALVLGCSVLKNGQPSKMLKDRLDKAIELFNNNLVDKIIISGDHNLTYSEVNVMDTYLIQNNIPKDYIIKDYIGYSTKDSINNYNKDFKDKTVIIISQNYHLYRALFISQKLNLNSIGAYAKNVNYHGQIFREIREILARNKDFFLVYIANYWM